MMARHARESAGEDIGRMGGAGITFSLAAAHDWLTGRGAAGGVEKQGSVAYHFLTSTLGFRARGFSRR